jgi:hypothetical protein
MSKPSTLPPDRSISESDWALTPESVRAYVSKLVEKSKRNSRNSSQPPSQDSPSQKQNNQDEKPKSERPRGEQAGHEGKGRVLLPLELVDEVIVYRPERCQHCGEALTGEDPAPYRYQVTELPVVKGRVVEHQVHGLVCACCQMENRGQLPAGVYRLSKRQVVHLLVDCFQVEIAVGSVVKQQQAVSAALAAPVAEVQAYVQQQAVCNMDETRWRQRGQPKTGWLWVMVTQVTTLFQVALSRSHEVAQALLGTDYAGVVGSDRAGSYAWLAVKQRQVCWSHLLRDFQRILERGGESFVIGTNLKLQGEYLLALWARSRDDPSQRAAFLAELPQIQRLVHDWLSQGATCSDSQTAKTCANLLALEPALWTFASQSGLEPTNHAAERALRHPFSTRQPVRRAHPHHRRVLPPATPRLPRFRPPGGYRSSFWSVGAFLAPQFL